MRRESKVSGTTKLAVGICLAAGGVGVFMGRMERPNVIRVDGARLSVSDTVLPACGQGTVVRRNLLAVSAHLGREDARRIARMRLAVDGRTWTVRREEGVCHVSAGSVDSRADPCVVEACAGGNCILRTFVDTGREDGALTVTARYEAADGLAVGEGRAAVPAMPARVEIPRLDVERDGRVMVVRAPDHAELSARVTVLRDGKAVADSPSTLNEEGVGSVTVPEGVDGAIVSVSQGAGGIVGQSTFRLPGPFTRDCAATNRG